MCSGWTWTYGLSAGRVVSGKNRALRNTGPINSFLGYQSSALEYSTSGSWRAAAAATAGRAARQLILILLNRAFCAGLFVPRPTVATSDVAAAECKRGSHATSLDSRFFQRFDSADMALRASEHPLCIGVAFSVKRNRLAKEVAALRSRFQPGSSPIVVFLRTTEYEIGR